MPWIALRAYHSCKRAGAGSRALPSPSNVCFIHFSFTADLAAAVLPTSVYACIRFVKPRACHLFAESFLPGQSLQAPQAGGTCHGAAQLAAPTGACPCVHVGAVCSCGAGRARALSSIVVIVLRSDAAQSTGAGGEAAAEVEVPAGSAGHELQSGSPRTHSGRCTLAPCPCPSPAQARTLLAVAPVALLTGPPPQRRARAARPRAA